MVEVNEDLVYFQSGTVRKPDRRRRPRCSRMVRQIYGGVRLQAGGQVTSSLESELNGGSEGYEMVLASPKVTDESTAQAQRTNAATLRQKAQQALQANAAFPALPPVQQQAQAVAQTVRLTQEVSALIRLVIGQLDSTAGPKRRTWRWQTRLKRLPRWSPWPRMGTMW
jgi:hypothetical protein